MGMETHAESNTLVMGKTKLDVCRGCLDVEGVVKWEESSLGQKHRGRG